jgi:hypothetical protein
VITPKSESPAAHPYSCAPSFAHPNSLLHSTLPSLTHSLPTPTTTHSTAVSHTAKYLSLQYQRSLHIQRSVRRLFFFASRTYQRRFHHPFRPILCFHFLLTRRFRHHPAGRDLKGIPFISSLYGQSLTRQCFFIQARPPPQHSILNTNSLQVSFLN